MIVFRRCSVAAALGALSVAAGPVSALAAPEGAVASIEAVQGTVVRWSVPGTLHFGVRWHNARIDPQFLLDDPAKIPAFGN